MSLDIVAGSDNSKPVKLPPNKGLELTHSHFLEKRILISRTQGNLAILNVSYEAAQA